MLWFNFLSKAIKLLHSDISPTQIAFGAALGAALGLTPFFGLLNVALIFLIFILNVNIGAAFLFAGFFGILGFLIDPLAHRIGYYLLVSSDTLTPFWTRLYNTPIVPFTRFYNTVVLGNLVIALLFFVPVTLVTKALVVNYRAKWRTRVEGLKIIQMMKLSAIYKIYDRYRQ